MAGPSHAAPERERSWAALGADVFDVLIIGAGITGSGIALDAAGRGLSVALVDAGDIGSGTSSRSSRLIHGGLRYLETFDLDLVFEALRERRRLLELAPHLVRPLPFLFPTFAGDSTGLAKLTVGMWLYAGLSLFRSPRRHRSLGKAGALEVEPKLRSDGLRGGVLYYDAQVDDARLTLAVARGALEAGATIVTHARVVALSPARERAGEAIVRDHLADRETTVRARVVINAAGPWSDRIRSLSDPVEPPRLRLTKGVHVLVPQQRVGNRGAVIFRSRVDERVMFVLPWGEFTYVGTTDTEFSGDPADARADPEDVRYLLDSANGIFPSARLQPADVVSTWAGVRPLLAPDPTEKLSASATSREHAIWRDPSGLLNVAGGKLTTYRSMAAEVTSRAARVLELEFGIGSGQCYTEFLRLPGAPETTTEEAAEGLRERAQAAGIDPESLAALVSRHGSNADQVVAIAEERPELASRIVPTRPYLVAEAVYSVRAELACTLEDVLRRRIPILYEAPDEGVRAAPALARLLAREAALDWTEQRVAREVDAYARLVRGNRAEINECGAAEVLEH